MLLLSFLRFTRVGITNVTMLARMLIISSFVGTFCLHSPLRICKTTLHRSKSFCHFVVVVARIVQSSTTWQDLKAHGYIVIAPMSRNWPFLQVASIRRNSGICHDRSVSDSSCLQKNHSDLSKSPLPLSSFAAPCCLVLAAQNEQHRYGRSSLFAVTLLE